MATLRLTLLEDGTVREFPADVRIGRSEENELSIAQVHVSAQHAVLQRHGFDVLVRDCQSTNGTRVRRGEQVVVADSAAGVPIESGDIIELGDRESPVRIQVDLGPLDDSAKIVSTRSQADVPRVEDALRSDRELIRGLYDAQKAIAARLDIDELIDAVAEEVFRFLSRATHVMLVVRDEDEEATRPRYVPVGTRVRGAGRSDEPIPITRSVFKKVVEEETAVLAADARRDVGETASIMSAQILSTIGVPLWANRRLIGVLQVDNRAAPGVFRESDLDLLLVISQAVGQSLAHARLLQRLRVAEERLRRENGYLRRKADTKRGTTIIGESAAMQTMLDAIRKVVDTRVTVFVEGETGTGKELVASAVHAWSNRRDRLFVAQNCAALPENLLESELFGHKRGSFTGATDDKKGLLEIADGGTMFLDEVTEMPLSLQAKLLRALQEGEIRPVGSNTTKKVDVRIVAATNRDLEKEVKEGRFREDLYYRLRVFPVRVPPLRERRGDVALLAKHFLDKYSSEFGKATGGFSQSATEVMMGYKWPGNVRELENEIQRLVIQVDTGAFIEAEHLSPRIRQVEGLVERIHPVRGSLRAMMDQVEKWILLEALREHDNNKSATAKTLGITREGLHKKLRSHGVT